MANLKIKDSNGNWVEIPAIKGDKGDTGVGIATGGTTRQVLTKNSDDDYDTGWETILDLVYPIGSIYMGVNNINPSTYLGGTWERWGTGRVPVGVDTTQEEFNEVEKTGGEKAHTLTVDEMPSHTHKIDMKAGNGGWTIASMSDGAGEYQADTFATGGNSPHNNLQPYITCYMWKRTA